MSPEGASAAKAAISAGDDVIVEAEPGRLTIYLERLAGALDRLIAVHDIDVLSKEHWDAKKAELGVRIFD